MAQELVYTSAPRGLRPGTSGYCTVAYSKGMSPSLIRLLESLSAYRPLYAAHDPRSRNSPVMYTHYRYVVEGKRVHILSRISLTGADHTNRSNKIAHHLVLTPEERPAGGPAWLAMQPGVFFECWEGPPCHLPASRELPQGDYADLTARTWAETAGDAGWAGVLAYAFLRKPNEPAYLLYDPGAPVLHLLAEALAFIPPEQRWDVTFNTFFSTVPAGTSCRWRCCVRGPDTTRELRRYPRALVLDLTQALPKPPEDCPLIANAREGRPVHSLNDATRRSPSFRLLDTRRRRNIRMRPGPPGDEVP